MDPKNTNFRIILALTTLPQDVNLTGASLKVTLANTTKTIPISNKEATPLDFSGIQAGSKLEFGLEDAEGFMFGYSELRIPNTAFEKNETEVNEQLRFYLINKEKDSFVASVYAIFLNKGLFKEKAKERGVLNKSRSGDRAGSRSPSPPGKRSPSKGKTSETKTTEKNFQAYLHRLVDNHSVQLKSLVDEHNSINEYIHMNKVHNNLPANFAGDSLETYSPVKLRTSGNLSAVIAESRELESPGTLRSPYKVSTSRTEERSFTREASSPLREKKAGLPPTEGTPVRRQDSIGTPVRRQDSLDRSPSQSPLRSKVLDRKLSEGSNASPVKRKQLAEISTSSRKDVPDTTFYNAQITTLNNVVVNQNARISDLEVHRKENGDLIVAVQKSEAARRTLQESVLETTNELKLENKELEKQIAAVVAEKELLLKKLGESQDKVHDLTNTLTATKSALQEKEDVNNQNAVRLVELNDLKQQFKKLQDSLIISENQKMKDQENYKNALAKFEVSLEDTKRTIDIMNQEKKKLIMDLNQIQQELSLERSAHQVTQNELLLTKKRLENAENYKSVINSIEAQRDQLNTQLADSRASHAQTQALLQESVEKLAARQREFEMNEKTFLRDTNVLTEKLSVSEMKGDRLTKDLNEQKMKVSQQNTTISSLEQLICVKEDISKQLEVTEKQLTQVLADRKELRMQLENVVVTQDQTNNKLFEAEKNSNQLRQIIEDRDQEIEQLTLTVIALRESQEVYVPTKDDMIDNAVADYINTGTDVSRLKLLFIRESEGVYQFGSKRVYVKLEGGRILLRVGGGFLTIDEFIEQYAPLEMEKVSRTDPLKKLSKNIAINKTLIGKCVNQIEKAKTQSYEYRTDANNMRIMNTSPSLQRLNSKGDY